MNAAIQAETLALAKGDQKRLEHLAEMAGRSPKAMLKFVLRDGFDAVEEEVRENLDAERDIDLNGGIPNDEARRRAKAIIETAHARKRKKTA